MVRHTSGQDRIVPIVRWLARLGSGLLVLGFLYEFVVSDLLRGGYDWAHPDINQVATLGLLLVALLALVMAWVWEGIGGVLLLVVAALGLATELSHGVVDGGPIVFAVLGCLFVYCWWATRQRARHRAV